jgi:hypothetical protein
MKIHWLLLVCGCLLPSFIAQRGAAQSFSVSTPAGLAGSQGSTDGVGPAARFFRPHGVAVDAAGNVYLADTDNHRIRKVAPDGTVTTLAGSGTPGSADGTGAAASFNFPIGLAVDGAGDVFVADTMNHTIRQITAAGVVTTLAGTAGLTGTTDGMGASARFNGPNGLAIDSTGDLYVADTENHVIRKIGAGGVVTTLAGSSGVSGSADGTGPAASFNRPYCIAVDSTGNLYVGDRDNATIRKITPAGDVSTLAGQAGSPGSSDGAGNAARFNFPLGIAVDSTGDVFVADYNNHVIRRVTQAGVVTTIAGAPGSPGSTDGPGPLARFRNPIGLAVDSAGALHVGDAENHTLRKLTPPVLTTLAGTVRNAATGAGLPGVSISVGTNTVVSDATGAYALPGLAVGPVQIVATNTGFIGLTNSLTLTNAPTNQFSFAMSPVILGANTFRIVLTWGAQPADLDSYTMTPVIGGLQHEVNFFNRGSLTAAPFVFLDVDDVNGFGPETTTITNLFPGTYEFYVENFSGTPAIAGSGAQVSVYSAAGLLQTITVPATGSGFYWRVLQIDGASGQLTVLNVVTNVQPTFPASTAPTIVNQPISQTGFRSNSVTFSVSASGANPLAYQWFFNSNVLAGATNTTLPLANLQTNQAGSYFVVVTNGFGGVTSSIATLTVLTNSQPPPFQWVNSVAGLADDVAESVKVDAAGNAYVAGFFSAPISFGNTNLSPVGFIDAFVAKYDPRGVCVWARRPGGRSLALDPAGNVLVSGEYFGTVAFGPTVATSAGGADIFLLKYDNAGTLLWSRQFGGTQDDNGSRVATDAAGNIYVAGDFRLSVAFGTNTLTSAGGSDFYLLKFDPSGALLWARQAGGAGNESNARVAVDAAGNALVTGAFQGTATFGTNTLASLGGNDVFIAKFDPAGNVLWARRAGGSGDDLGNELTVGPAGSVFVAGEFTGVAGFGTTNLNGLGGTDAFVAQYDAAGALVRLWHVGSAGEDRARGVGVDAAGNLHVHGEFTGTLTYRGLPVTSIGGGRDLFVLKTDGAGNPIWLKRAGGAGADISGNLALAPNGDVLLTGATVGNAGFDNLALASAGGSDVYLTKIPANLGPLPAPTGMVGWWAGEGFAVDYAWTNHGVFVGGATNTSGKVGAAFDLNSSSQFISIPRSPLWAFGTNDFAVELWANFRNAGVTGDLVGFDSGPGNNQPKWFFRYQGNGTLTFHVNGPGLGNGVFLATVPFSPSTNQWYHLAAQRSGNTFTLFVNGQPLSSEVSTVSIPDAGTNLTIGWAEGSSFFDGQIDEVSIYNRALAPTELQSIFTADAFGKARPAAPTLLAAPAPLTVDQGAPALFGVAAAGHAPLSYQWRFNGTNLLGQTNATLTIPAAYSVHEGNYDVRVTQLGGAFLTSPSAALNVLGQGEVKTLFGVTNDVVNFTRLAGGAVPWTLTSSNAIVVVPGTGSIQSTQTFGDFLLHVEFRCPNPTDVANGNSGIYLQNRYEIQIFNSFGVAVPGLNDAGAIWGQTPPSTNAALPAGQWQTYDIHFRQPQWNGNTKVADARVTVVLNGVTVQDNVAITNRTGAGAPEGPTRGPVVLQDNGSSVQFRNVRITPLDLPPEFAWSRQFGSTNAAGNNTDFARDIATDAAGNIYVTGSFFGTANFGPTNLTSAGDIDFFLAKYTPAGALVWIVRGGGPNFDSGQEISLGPDGSVYVAGLMESGAVFGTNAMSNAGGHDLFLAKYTPDGQLVWVRGAGGSADDGPHGVTVDAAGNVYVTGHMQNNFAIGGTNLISGGQWDYFLAKYDAAGSLQWVRQGVGTDFDYALGVATDAAGNVYTAVTFQSPFGLGATNFVNLAARDLCLASYDGNGTLRWARQFPLPGMRKLGKLRRDPAGSLLLTLNFSGTVTLGTNTLQSAGSEDVLVAKFDANGSPLWARQGGSAGDDFNTGDLAVDAHGNAYVVTSFVAPATFSATPLPNAGTDDVVVAQYNAAGAQLWALALGSAGTERALGVAVGPDGQALVGGTFANTIDFRGTPLASFGGNDGFVLKLAEVQPAITQQPVGGNVLAGQNATFSVTATGTGPVTYQWRFNGTNLPGATNASFTLANATTNSAGAYDVLVTHAFGTATSSPAVITVIPSANPLPFTFAERYGGTGAESVQGLARDAAGNSYLAGYFTGTLALGTTNLVSAGGDDIFVAKISPAGTVLWAAHCGGPGEDRATGLALDPNGDVVAVGWFDNNAVFGTNGAVALSVNLAAFTLRLSADGVLAGFHKTDFSGAGAGILRVRNFAVAVDAAGAVYVAGKGDDTNNFGGFTFGRPEVWGYLVKYDRAGSVQWIQASDRAPGTTQNVVGMAVALDQTGGVYLGGYYGLPGGNSGTNAIIGGVTLPYGGGDADAFIAKFNAATGAPVWTRGLHGPGRERVARLATDPAGNVFAYGDFSGPVNFGPGLLTPSNGSAGTGLLLKLDAAGTVVWAREAGAVGGSVLDFGALAVDPAGNVHVAHHFTGTSLLGNPAAVSLGGRDGLVTKFAANGAFLWAQTFGSPGDDFVNGLVFDTNFNLHVAGTLGGAATFGSFPLTNAGASDWFLARLAAIPPVILAQPASQTVNVNQSATFAVAVTGTLPITYQWRFNGANLPGATNAAFTVPAVTPASAGTYSVLVSDALGLAVSSNAVLAVDTSNVPVIFTQPQDQSAQQGQAVLFTVGAAGGQPLSYQWRKNGTNLAGAVFSFLPLGGVTTNDMGSYTVVITNVFGAVTSAPAMLTVTPIFPPVITTPPQALTVLAGSNATFSVSVSGTAPFSYQWVRNGVALSGNDAPTLTVTNAGLADAGTYFVQVFNSAGLASSTPVTLTVQAPPQFLALPSAVTILEGRTTNFAAVAAGFPAPAYAWFRDGVRLVNSVGYSGVSTTNLLVHSATAGHAGQYYVVATNVAGSVTSAPVTLTVLLAPVFTTHPTNVLLTRTNYLVDLPVTLTVAATGAPPLLYQWRFNGADLPGETNTTLALTNVTRLHNCLYQATVTNIVGAATSSNALVRVRVPQRVAPPVFTPGQPFRLRFTDDNGEQPAAVDLARIEVQFTTNLLRTNTVWVTLTNGFSIVGGMVELDDPASTNAVRRYYRVIEK